ncbi:UNVERIFIED_CONTAM: hypothetical protein Sindi_2282600 [Sesamum indicum]
MAIEQQLQLAAVGGKNKGRVFDLGSEAHISNRTHISPSPPLQSNSAMEDRIDQLKDDSRHHDHDEGDAGQLLDCRIVTTNHPSTASDEPPKPNDDEMYEADKEGLD